ncbi:hypothetical protein AAA799B03_00378 [Marine Group I thaumarchaeote SCGC AAA799-B03]|uniref:Uncharacterized protein n=3 Tax=Marine Group I TaxID=905826 RepID=A0A087S8I6_9ARCH|nr:hypothetical protein AAA799N04_00401 [Marine Group I thaumarchaeote SCGC AAA799-N04]KFM18067.1 hypothetical protein SCCGRSA3_01421 [Marine Group I thaumarchaeote SCGC RSA3]KFM22040.1 hypothetical protein AAA799B03_00378 [Marine Group I thaumarchaeote SCGC AAA799-B03]
MENPVHKHLRDLYGLNPNIPHLALQFPRLPPGLTHPMFGIHQNPVKEQFSRDVESVSQKLQGFQHMYQQYASGLLTGNQIVPPGHPLYTRQNSVQTLQAEKDKLLKENTELKKKLEKESKKQD